MLPPAWGTNAGALKTQVISSRLNFQPFGIRDLAGLGVSRFALPDLGDLIGRLGRPTSFTANS